MLLSSPSFLAFLSVSAILFYLFPIKYRNWVLLCSNIIFYCFNTPQYLPLIVITEIWAFVFGKLIAKNESERKRKNNTVIGIAGVAFFFILFKYCGSFLSTLLEKTPMSSWMLNSSDDKISLILPVGIGFYSLSLMGYLIDIFNRKIAPEDDLLIFTDFVLFFPAILSGPINKAEKLLPQFRKYSDWNYAGTVKGLRRFLMGAVKKVVLADGLSLLVNGVWSNLNDYSGLSLMFVMLLYSVQLYGDFSGYSDMAIGTAFIFGFELEENFTAPFMALSFSELWSRWHNSLSGWLKNYIYFPLGGSRKGFKRKIVNIFIVFLASGLWHGTGSTFLVWGLLTALFRVMDELFSQRNGSDTGSSGVRSLLRRVRVFIVFSAIFVFFRADTLNSAVYFFGNIFRELSVLTTAEQMRWLSTADIANGAFYSVLYWGGILFGLILTIWSDVFVYKRPDNTDSMMSEVKSPALRMILYWVSGIIVMMFYFIQYTKTSGSVSFIYSGF